GAQELQTEERSHSMYCLLEIGPPFTTL
ncbi:MAG: hypothetical protein ACI828_001331, partial [Flavobacteriales bacterium]